MNMQWVDHAWLVAYYALSSLLCQIEMGSTSVRVGTALFGPREEWTLTSSLHPVNFLLFLWQDDSEACWPGFLFHFPHVLSIIIIYTLIKMLLWVCVCGDGNDYAHDILNYTHLWLGYLSDSFTLCLGHVWLDQSLSLGLIHSPLGVLDQKFNL